VGEHLRGRAPACLLADGAARSGGITCCNIATYVCFYDSEMHVPPSGGHWKSGCEDDQSRL